MASSPEEKDGASGDRSPREEHRDEDRVERGSGGQAPPQGGGRRRRPFLDPVGTFARYSLATSLLGGLVEDEGGGER